MTAAASALEAVPAVLECREEGVLFNCGQDRLVGVISAPPAPAADGILIVVGGPQYRAGSHRQFVEFSRALAAHGIACMRFDCRGMGDSDGVPAGFEGIDSDIRAAIEAFLTHHPSIERLTLWGLCDGASAICFYAAGDARVQNVVLVNPWVRTEAGEAAAQLRHYYVGRLLNRGFWTKLFSGNVDFSASARSFTGAVRRRFGVITAKPAVLLGLPERMAADLDRFDGRILVILSGDDLTAREFETASRSRAWSSIMRRADRRDLPQADHTFSDLIQRDQVARITARWLQGEG